MSGIRIAFHTLGCRLNQFETESLASRFLAHGYSIVDFSDPADAYILNTCTVTGKSDRKCRNMIHKMLEKNALTVVTGCYADAEYKELRKTGIDLVIRNNEKQDLFIIVDSHLHNIRTPDRDTDVFNYPPADAVFHTRGTVKIHDGCNNFCSFCIIPFVRGRAHSMKPVKVLENVRKTIQKGFREITLTGVNISRYHYEGKNFTSLVSEILRLDGDFRLRISSIEPDCLSDDFIDLFHHPRMCHHLHLCLQSGSDLVLKNMKRHYTYADYSGFVHKMRAQFPLFNFTTDIMVGFPGETEADFSSSLFALRELNFGHVHTFPYSVRTGTLAAKMSGQIDEQVKKDRAKQIRMESEIQKKKYRKSLLGIDEIVLSESAGERIYGLCSHYVPVSIASNDGKVNEIYRVKIGEINKNLELSAEISD